MAKLQQIIRQNGSVIHNITIPSNVIDEMGWNKGDIIEFEKLNNSTIKLKKER